MPDKLFSNNLNLIFKFKTKSRSTVTKILFTQRRSFQAFSDASGGNILISVTMHDYETLIRHTISIKGIAGKANRVLL